MFKQQNWICGVKEAMEPVERQIEAQSGRIGIIPPPHHLGNLVRRRCSCNGFTQPHGLSLRQSRVKAHLVKLLKELASMSSDPLKPAKPLNPQPVQWNLKVIATRCPTLSKNPAKRRRKNVIRAKQRLARRPTKIRLARFMTPG